MGIRLCPVYTIAEGETEVVAIDYTDHLGSEELLTGSPTATLVGSGDLVTSEVGVNAATMTILSRDVVAGKAVKFKVKSQVAGHHYVIKVTVSTDSNPARTIVREIELRVV